MRTTILPSMLEILTRNYNFRNKEAALYEIGRIYLKRPDGMADEPKIVSLGAYGEKMNFFVLKGWVEKLLKELGAQKLCFVAEKLNPAYHPGRCAKVYAGGVEIGVLGQIHPLVAANYGVDAEIYCAELKFDALNEAKGALPVYKPLPRFPSVTRDIAVVCKANIPVGDMVDCIMANGGQYLKDCASLTMRSDEQTLTVEHAEETVAKVLKALADNYGAVIR